jgi:hypothetical protein
MLHKGLPLIRHAHFSTHIARSEFEFYSDPFTNISHMTPTITVLLEKPSVTQSFNKFPQYYETRMFITTLTKAYHQFLP